VGAIRDKARGQRCDFERGEGDRINSRNWRVEIRAIYSS
jgi:hypothetical protein